MLPRKVINLHGENRLKNEGNIAASRNKIHTNRNLDFLLKKRFGFVEKNINKDDHILEIGCGAGHAKHYIKNKNLKISDITNYDFLDFKKVDCLNTQFDNNSFDVVFSSNLIHHLPNPIRLFNEVGRILKKKGKYIILDVNLSFFLKLVIILTKSEKYNLDVNIFDKNLNLTDPSDPFDSNNAIPNLIFNDFQKFNEQLDYKFKIEKLCYEEFLIFLNSGGVIIDAPHVPLNNTLNKLIDKFDKFLSMFSRIFPLEMYICLSKE